MSIARPSADAIEDRLLKLLADQLDTPGLAFAERPTLLGDGVTARAYAFRLDGVEGPAGGPLVCRLFLDDAASLAHDQARLEAVLHNALADCGVPIPRVFASGDAASVFGAPFMVMERVPGWNLFAPIIAALCIASGLLLVGVWAPLVVVLLGYWAFMTRLLTRVHAVPADRVRQRLDEAGFGPERLGTDELIERIAERVERGGFDGLQDLVTWLREHRALATGPTVACHGDFWFGNVMVAPGSVSLLDWTQSSLAPRELDLAWMGIQNYSRAPLALPISDRAYDVIAMLLSPFTWLLFAANRGSYRLVAPLDSTRLRYFTVLQCARVLVSIAEARREGDADSSGPLLLAWGSRRTVALLQGRVRRLSGVSCELE